MGTLSWGSTYKLMFKCEQEMNRKTCYFSFLSFDLELLKEFKKKNHGILFCLLLLQRTWRNVSAGTELGNKSEWWVIRLCIYIPTPPALFQSFTRVLGFSSCAPTFSVPSPRGRGASRKTGKEESVYSRSRLRWEACHSPGSSAMRGRAWSHSLLRKQ